MPRNVEIKARLTDPEATRARVAAAADHPPDELEQRDTFFRVKAGRLKLRELPGGVGGGRGELIYYVRPDTPQPSESEYEKVECPEATGLRALLATALGVTGEVRKRRLAYRVGRTRVHLDEVEGLGSFLELEVELEGDEPVEAGAREAKGLMRRFGVRDDALVAEAYVDLLFDAASAPRR